MRSLPLGIQTFSKIIENNHIYVDKTKHIYDLIKHGSCYFFSRPRRFGKSLLCSTLEQIFLGNKELFKNLWIYDSDYDWKPHPVIRFDMSKLDKKSPKRFEQNLTWKIKELALSHDIDLGDAPSIGAMTEKLIAELSKKHGSRVVVIVDEYDDPILEHINNEKTAEEMKEVLRDFYKIFKSSDEYIKFIFLTGITRFSKISVFSGLNQLKDITMSSRFSDLLGYTQNELETYFKQHIKATAKERSETIDETLRQIRHWYNGYRFSKKVLSVYNPFSVMTYFDAVVIDGDPDFSNYWFKTGTPTFLIKLMQKNAIEYAATEPVRATQNQLENFNIQTLPIKTILYQAGYLTISNYYKMEQQYKLDFPNAEVRESLLDCLLVSMSHTDEIIIDNLPRNLLNALEKEDFNLLQQHLYQLYVEIPYTIKIASEKYYQTIFLLAFKFLGIKIDVEVVTNIGRIDATITLPNKIYIIEFKIDQSADIALQQIKKKKYYEKFLGRNKKLILVGVNFDMKKRNITELKSECLIKKKVIK